MRFWRRIFSAQESTIYRPYKARASCAELPFIVDMVNASVYNAYCKDLPNGPDDIYLASLEQYAELLKELLACPNLRFVTVCEFMNCQPQNESIVTLRHDVDCDLVGAVYQADVERQLGIASSYYILHTAPYYGTLSGGVFQRNVSCVPVYKWLEQAGHEIGLHIDPYWFYLQHQIDGTKAVESELKWLRDNGISIRGTAGHNSPDFYGAHSWEIFSDLKSNYRYPLTAKRYDDRVEFEANICPINTTSQSTLALEYEADRVRYFDSLPYEASLYNRGSNDLWLYGKTYYHQGRFEWELPPELRASVPIRTAELASKLRSLPNGSKVVLAIHPVYFGHRLRADHPATDEFACPDILHGLTSRLQTIAA